MLLAALALGVLALAGLVTPVVLLGLVFALGAGQAWTSPTWQTLQPSLCLRLSDRRRSPSALSTGTSRARPPSAVAPEHVGEAIRAGGRYVAASPALRVVLLRAAQR
jgi:hypothetical protein